MFVNKASDLYIWLWPCQAYKDSNIPQHDDRCNLPGTYIKGDCPWWLMVINTPTNWSIWLQCCSFCLRIVQYKYLITRRVLRTG